MTMQEMLRQRGHRPWPPPDESWILAQTWHDLLFAHWHVAPEVLRPLLPPKLPLDTFDGRAWIGVVPFRMSGIRLRGTPALPMLSSAPEINVRTYATLDGKPGVWFFSLDIAHWLGMAFARTFYHLPYYYAQIECDIESGEVRYQSRRAASNGRPAEFAGTFAADGPSAAAAPGTLEHFLVERYCLYAADASGKLHRAEIHHPPWPLQRATARIERNTMTRPLGVELTGTPLLHFAKELQVAVWRPRAI